MIYGAELLFDPTTEEAVLDIWRKLRDQGITSSMFDVGAKPHVTIAVWENVDVPRVQEAIGEFCQQTGPVAANLTYAGSFITSPGVVFLAPTPSRELLDFHRNFHEFLSDFPASSYTPQWWEPHCTVAIDLSPEQVGPAIQVCKSGGKQIRGTFGRIVVIRYPPTEHLKEFELAGR